MKSNKNSSINPDNNEVNSGEVEEKQKHRSRRRRSRLIWTLVILACLVILAIEINQKTVYEADTDAHTALTGSDSISVSSMDKNGNLTDASGGDATESNRGYFFDGPDKDTLIILYPGARVEPEAYGPLCRKIAAGDADVFLMRAPLYLSITDVNEADKVLAGKKALEKGTGLDKPGGNNSYKYVYVAGHSMGASVAGMYAAKHLDSLNGVIMLAGYPTKDLHHQGFSMLSVYGSRDGHTDMLKKNKNYRPSDYTQYVIKGGNHAQFGNYGIQSGDGKAYISRTEQQNQTVEVISRYLKTHNK